MLNTHFSQLFRITLVVLLLVLGMAVFTATPALAQLSNPAIQSSLGDNPTGATSGSIFVSYLVTIWRAVIFVGGLLLILYLVWGGIEWLTAAGDKGKVEKAREKMTQAVTGMIILAASFTIVGFISATFFGNQFNLLNPVIPVPAGGPAGSTGGSGGSGGGGGSPLGPRPGGGGGRI